MNQSEISSGLREVIANISASYVYLDQKEIDTECLISTYEKKIKTLTSQEDVILFYEYLFDELYDSHVSLNTNIKSSYRLYAPIYANFEDNKPIIRQGWISQMENPPVGFLGAEILKLNGVEVEEVIARFPTECQDKTDPKVKEWLLNKVLAGRYDQPRVLELMTQKGTLLELDLDQIQLKAPNTLVSSERIGETGIIRINNALGNNDLISEFDIALDQLMDTEGIIIDLRNTVSGGNSYVARGIMSRFIEEEKPYQKHLFPAKWDGQTQVNRTWMEYVTPRGIQYQKPVVVLVGRWTGSMGEGLAIGFDGMERATVVGTEMARLAGEVNGFSIKHQSFGFQLPTAKLYHVNGQAREAFSPEAYVRQTTSEIDEIMVYALEILSQ